MLKVNLLLNSIKHCYEYGASKEMLQPYLFLRYLKITTQTIMRKAKKMVDIFKNILVFDIILKLQ